MIDPTFRRRIANQRAWSSMKPAIDIGGPLSASGPTKAL